MNPEEKTRTEQTNIHLKKSGWNILDCAQLIQVFSIPQKGSETSALLSLQDKHIPLTQELINMDIAGKDYQIRAIHAASEKIEQQKHNCLLIMADNSTGKPRNCIDMILTRAGYVEKVQGLKSRYQQSFVDLQELYDALSQKVFKGELDLSRVSLVKEGTK